MHRPPPEEVDGGGAIRASVVYRNNCVKVRESTLDVAGVDRWLTVALNNRYSKRYADPGWRTTRCLTYAA
jgi:hypothetical protein